MPQPARSAAALWKSSAFYLWWWKIWRIFWSISKYRSMRSILFLPYLLSWVVAAFLLFSFLSFDRGIVNQWLGTLGMQPRQWYSVARYWVVILPLAYLWKNVGYFCVIFCAGLTGISQDYYEAAEIDGASRVHQAMHITVPSLMPIVITLVLLQTGKIFFVAFGDWDTYDSKMALVMSGGEEYDMCFSFSWICLLQLLL